MRKGTGDPWLKHPTWRKAVGYWRGLLDQGYDLYCARCGRLITALRLTPWSLDVGHVVSRADARALGWTVEQANALGNTQPEHARCGRSAGATDGNRARASARAPIDMRPIEADEW
jgi:hypothetical protein